jgi:Fe-Mn family superoxide dismutase
MDYISKKFDALLDTPGFSDTLLKNHFTLYEGYVKNVNTLAESLGKMPSGTPEYNELKRRFGWEWNGMRLHELYFNNMVNATSDMGNASTLKDALSKFWGSTDNWLKDFKATGTMRGIGWTILYHDPETKRLFNIWVNEHDMGHLVGCTPLLVLDVFEHAYMNDYGLKRADYIDAFIQAIDWGVVGKRFIQ